VADLLILDDARMDLHDPGPGHPERPGRLRAVREALQGLGAGAGARTPASRTDLGGLARLVHSGGHVERIDGLRGRSARLDPDTAVCPESVEAAWTAVGAAVDLVEALFNGAARRGLALVRPPGHHAEPDRAMGFCLLNNIAIAAAHAIASGRANRVLIVDWDVHHGNGTQSAFYERSDVMYFSVHEWPLFPGTGATHESGAGIGAGATCNAPLPAGAGDDEYLAVFDRVLVPLADRFRPDLVLVSAGFDAHHDDPLGGMRVTTDGFAAMCRRSRRLAEEHAEGRLGLVLEGGYSLPALGRSVRACADALVGPLPRASERPESPVWAPVEGVIAGIVASHPALARRPPT